jgi:hypothetical protein
MDKNTVYILQKDLPNAKAGDKYESTDSGENYINLNAMATWDVSYPKEYIENNSDWFVKEEVNESKPTEKKQWEDEDDDFLWTNELVMEFVNFHDEQKGIHWLSEDIEKFKKSKSKKEEPQWEILEFKNLRSGIVYIKKDNGKFNSGNGLDWDLEKFDIKDHEIINSVKRFPDNTVWSVDMVTEHGIITAFKIIDKDMWAVIKGKLYEVPLVALEEALPKETPKPEWEILKLEIGGVNYPIDALNEKEKSIAKIYSVKRLSDGEVFSVGDKVISDANIQAPHTVIDSITIVNDYMIYFNSIPFDRAIKVKLEAPKEEQVVKLYTESELLQACRDAFDESRIMFRIVSALPTGPQFKHLTFEDYINSLK